MRIASWSWGGRLHVGTIAADGVRLLATPDQGATWYLVTPTPGYTHQACDAFTDAAGNSSPVWAGSSGGWRSFSVDVSAAAQAAPKWIFAWEIATDYDTNKAGFFLDDIKVTAR